MKLKLITGIVLTLFLTGMLTLAFNIQPAKSDWTWTETIYIRADGSVEPDTAPISSVDSITYILTDNIIGVVPMDVIAIVVERDNIVIDGAGYTLQGTGNGTGIYLSSGSNVTIRNINIKGFTYGIMLSISFNNIISGNNIANNDCGILLLYFSNNNTFSSNNITNNYYGIELDSSSNNTISGNNITNNYYSIQLVDSSSNNTISGNNIANSQYGILLEFSSNNTIFHNNFVNNPFQVYTSESVNVWDDGYPSGGNYWSDYGEKYPDAEEINGSGIWDTPYVIDENNQDNYPIVPEFPTWTSMLLILIVLTVAIAIYKRKLVWKELK